MESTCDADDEDEWQADDVDQEDDDHEIFSDEDGNDGFDLYDTDGSGKIDSKELKHAMNDLGFELTLAQVDEAFLEFDFDGSGTIGYEEFHLLLTDVMSHDEDRIGADASAHLLLAA